MIANPALKKLGLAKNDRVVIFHADDIGMFQSSINAYADIVDFGLLTSAAVMVPCPWFLHAAEFCRKNQMNKNIDMGVHLTITSEWRSYRWGPVSTRDMKSGLIDPFGYFFENIEAVQKHANIDAVSRELQTQIDYALASGIDVTHIDSHMGALFHPKFLDAYLRLAQDYQLPALFLRQDGAGLRLFGINAEMAEQFIKQVPSLEEKGMPLVDNLYMMSLDRPENRRDQIQQVLKNLPPGISVILIHPCKDTQELRAAAWPEDWPNRIADFSTFIDEEFRGFVKQSGIHLIGYRRLRELMRQK